MNHQLDTHVKAYERQSIYDFDNLLQLKWYPKRIIERTSGANSLLELGLGHGVTTEIFNHHFKRHVVIDASPAVIANFHQLYPACRPEIVQTYFENFASAEQFEVMVFGYILEHVENPVQIMALFKPFLAPGGRVFVTVPNAAVLNRRLGHLAGMLSDMTELSEHDLLLGHRRYYTVDTLETDIEAAGYKLVSMEGIYLKPLTTAQILSLNLDERILDALCQVGVDYPELSCGLLAEISPNAS
ncbi:MAG: class I SAM-dependent methyltransferase [Verrucomicrobia bacterium]|nr:class I SAM-dependent methyltransferase [Verrucomicrobiota bacterium]